jgi:hypothetical protein
MRSIAKCIFEAQRLRITRRERESKQSGRADGIAPVSST